jgi:hypothetical protein
MRHTISVPALLCAALVLPAAARAGDGTVDEPGTVRASNFSYTSPMRRPVPTSDPRVLWALGLRANGLFIPQSMLTAEILTVGGGLDSWGMGLELTRRKGNFDIVIAANVASYNFPNGNWLAAFRDPALDNHYLEFRDFYFLSLDVNFLYVHDMAPWIAFTVGGGVGLGAVLGDVYIVNNGPQCTVKNAGDPTKCFPRTPPAYPAAAGPITYTTAKGQTKNIPGNSDIAPSDPEFHEKLDGLRAAQQRCLAALPASPNANQLLDCKDTANHPYWRRSPDVPPIMASISFLIGLKLKIHRNFNFNIQGGFRNGFVIGGGPEVVF